MGTSARLGRRLSGFWFAFFVGVGVLSSIVAIGLYAVALSRGGRLLIIRDGAPGVGRVLPLVAMAAFVTAIVIARHLSSRSGRGPEPTRFGMTAGVAGAGVAVLIGVVARDATDPAEIGRLQIAFGACALLTSVASPLIARAMVRFRLIERFALLTPDEKSDQEDREPARTWPRSWESTAVIGGLVVVAAGLAYVLSSGPLGHDESVYALKARSWLEGTPSTGFGVYRPPGLAAIGWVILHFSDSEVAFRSAGLALAVVAVAVMWVTGRTMLSPAAAWIGAGVFVASAPFLRRATEFLNDLTAAAFLLATMLVIWYHFERRPGGWWIVAAAPLGAAAYYVRYGTAPGLVIIGIVAGAVWFTRVGQSWKQIATTAVIMTVLMIPHVRYSVEQTGSMFGVFGSARSSVGGGGGGLGDYLGWFPHRLAGPFGAVLMAAGLVFTILLVARAIRDHRWPQDARTAVFLTVPAIAFTIVLGAFTHGEPRFVFMPIMALLLVGGQAVVMSMLCLQRTARRVVAVAIAIAVLSSFVPGVYLMRDTAEDVTSVFDVVVEAADAIRVDAGSGACSIRSSYVPQLTWYSACSTYTFTDGFPTGKDPAYMVLFENGKRQPEGTALDEELARTPGTPLTMIVDRRDRIGDASVYEYQADGG